MAANTQTRVKQPPVLLGEAGPEVSVRQRRVKPAWTVAQARQQQHIVEALMLRGVRSLQTMQDAIEAKLGQRVSVTRLRTLCERIAQRWSFEDRDMRPIAKGAAERRILKYIGALQARAEDANNPRPALYSQIHRFEELLAKIQGTEEPVQLALNAQVTSAMMDVIGVMDESTMRALVSEQQALEAAFLRKSESLSQYDTAVIHAGTQQTVPWADRGLELGEGVDAE